MNTSLSLLPTQNIYKVLGVCESDVERISKDSEVRNSTSRYAVESADKQLKDYMVKLVRKMKQPGDDNISKLVAELIDLDNLSEADVTTLA